MKSLKPYRTTLIISTLLTSLYFTWNFFAPHHPRLATAELKELKQEFELAYEQAERFKPIQLDSAKKHAEEALNCANTLKTEQLINDITLLLSEIEFLRSGADSSLIDQLLACEKWYRSKNQNINTFKANHLRLKVKAFFQGDHVVRDKTDQLINLAKRTNNNKYLAEAYYFKMEHRDFTRSWEKDVYLLDSARIFASKAKDSILLSKIRIMSVLPINGKQNSFDSTFLSLKEAIKWNSNELKCMSYVSLGMEYAPTSKSDSAEFYFHKGIDQAKVWRSETHELYSYCWLVRSFTYSMNHQQLLKAKDRALYLAKKTNNKPIKRMVYTDVARSWTSIGEFSKGISAMQKVIQLAEGDQDEMNVQNAKKLLVSYLIKADRLDEAIVLATEQCEWAKNRERSYVNDANYGFALYMKARVLSAQGNYDEAVVHIKKAIEIIKDNATSLKYLFNIELFDFSLEAGNYKIAEETHDYICENFDNYYLEKSDFLHSQGRLLYALGEIENSILAFEEYLGKPTSINPNSIYIAHRKLAEMYNQKMNYKEAAEHSAEALRIKIQLANKDEELHLEKLQSKYELAQKEGEIQKIDNERLKQKSDLKEQENALNTRRLYIVLLSFLLALLALIILFINRRSKEARVREELERNALDRERKMEQFKAEESIRTSQLKNQLFANISHEFRTPLTLIQAPVEEMIERYPEEKESLQIVQQNTEHLLIMVEELLELARLDSGNRSLSKKAFDVHPFIHKLQTHFEPILRQKNILFTVELPTTNFSAIADEFRLRLILNNILKNAFHHTPINGRIRLTLKTNKDTLTINVVNSGQPINEAFLPYIFDRYARSTENEYSGYGIGLSLCKQIVLLHKGDIEAKNVEGGVQFSFTIPTKIEELAPQAVKYNTLQQSVNKQSNEIASGSKVLIVEDNPQMRALLKEILEPNYEISMVENGEEGIQTAKELQPDLIVSDIMMPKVDGTELAKSLKQDFDTCHIPIILLTARATMDDRIKGLEVGADEYLTKPFSPKELKARIKNLIEQRERLRKHFSKNVFFKSEEITTTSLDKEFLERATTIVHEHILDSEFNVEKFCRALALNRNSVHQKLKSLTGISATQFIRSIKLKKAATYLHDERISIVEVSELSGFNNRQAFNKAFKESFEMTPSEYRNRCLQK